MNRDIIKYKGDELKWSTEDVYHNADRLGIEIKSLLDAKKILYAAFQDNESLMEYINDEIADKIETFYKE